MKSNGRHITHVPRQARPPPQDRFRFVSMPHPGVIHTLVQSLLTTRQCCARPRVWCAQLAMRRTPSVLTYAVTGSGSARRWVMPSSVAVYLTWRGG
eukprot:scaffold142748_cov118-Phaeocystis_antarctica.AAC.1